MNKDYANRLLFRPKTSNLYLPKINFPFLQIPDNCQQNNFAYVLHHGIVPVQLAKTIYNNCILEDKKTNKNRQVLKSVKVNKPDKNTSIVNFYLITNHGCIYPLL